MSQGNLTCVGEVVMWFSLFFFFFGLFCFFLKLWLLVMWSMGIKRDKTTLSFDIVDETVYMQISEGPSANNMTQSLFHFYHQLFQFSTALSLACSSPLYRKQYYFIWVFWSPNCFWQWNCCINGNEICWQHCEGKTGIMTV